MPAEPSSTGAARPSAGASTPPDDPRTAPRAAGAMAEMFDDVSGRYDLLNRVMSLGRDRAWRQAMRNQVPESAHAVLDLCTGNGVSLEGLRRPGRLVVGVDVSLGMLEMASEDLAGSGWAPRLVCADAFHLPVREGAFDAATIAFGIRNLRPRREALAEIARVMAPGGRLVVLEGTAPAPGPFAPFHRFYLERIVPLMGRLSDDPSAYAYLGRSILEFGAGPEFERDLVEAGFEVVERRAFMLGATRLWVARRDGTPRAAAPAVLQPARVGQGPRGEMRIGHSGEEESWRWWTGTQLGLSIALLVTLIYALRVYGKWAPSLPLEPWQRSGMRVLLWLGIVLFALRSGVLWSRFQGPPRRR